MRRNAGGNYQNLVKSEPVRCGKCKSDVPRMGRIEGSSENSDFYGNLSLFKVNLFMHNI